MPTVIIIGFGYYGKSHELTSTITDIYHLYANQKKLNRTVYIFSDMVQPKKPEGILNLLSSNSVDSGFFSFIEREFEEINNLVYNKDELNSKLEKINLSKDGRLIFYYTGHGIDGNFLLPNGDKYSSLELRKKLFEINDGLLNSENANILLIVDCCNPHGMYLPFKLNKNFEHEKNSEHYTLADIIMIASAEFETEAQTTNDESTFTKFFLKYLNKNKTLDFQSIIEYVNKRCQKLKINQECTMYTSKIQNEILWSWVKSDFEIKFDPFELTINFISRK